MNQLFFGSINISELLDQLKQRHSGFTKAQNGKIYASVNVWLNTEKDKFGNVMSIKVSPSKEKKDIEQGFYIGNCKPSDGPKPISNTDIPEVDLDIIDPLPHQQHPNVTPIDDSSDLPF